ncbi:MAG: sigma 54-interacting transcriptional regulator [Smithella sp.]|nr:sigma 54-interacting transcriptional regulator [Smithella sp.]
MVLNGDQLIKKMEENNELIEASLPFIKNLYTFVRGSGFVVVLADSEGFLLKIVGDEIEKKILEESNLVVGACWAKKIMGKVDLSKPNQFLTGRPFSLESGKWTCSGAPLRNHDGKMIGYLNMTGPSQNANYHTLGMVAAAAYAIEKSLHQKKTYEKYEMANSFKETVIESISEALIAIDTEGVIALINEKAKGIFDLPIHLIMGKNIRELLTGRENRDILSKMLDDNDITDIEVKIFDQKKYDEFTMTCNKIRSYDKRNVVGKIIMLNGINRARALTTRMVGANARFQFENIIGENVRFLHTVKLAKMVARSYSTVLLLGESGTGKDVFAQAIHNASERKDKPFVAINCAAIPRDLISTELFGYSGGAFTGSKRGGNQGKFELADEGTIFLDEVSEMPLELQANLLRVLEEKAITRIGGRETIPINIRVIAASNRNLKELVQNKSFREDLYYRLNVFTMEMIPLRERQDDIPILTNCFVKNISKRMGKEIKKIDEEVFKIFAHYTWPGNVRELQNVIERIINIVPANAITPDLIPLEVIYNTPNYRIDTEIAPIDEIERQVILKLLQHDLSKNSIAKRLNISRATLYRRLEKYKFEALLTSS